MHHVINGLAVAALLVGLLLYWPGTRRAALVGLFAGLAALVLGSRAVVTGVRAGSGLAGLVLGRLYRRARRKHPSGT